MRHLRNRDHWTANATYVDDKRCVLLAEDDRGEILAPSRREGVWQERFNPRHPSHWLPWLRSRLRRQLAWVEAIHPEDATP